MDHADDPVEWRVSEAPVPYAEAIAAMEARAAAVADGTAPELIWLLEHPHVYTAGTSAAASELLDARFPVVRTGRGGRYTYHGPGQRIVYPILNLARRGRDVRGYVHALEGWAIATLARLGIAAHAAPGRVGIWTGDGGAEAKIGAIGVRVRRWVTLHGLAVNVRPDLAAFGGIVPCGLPQFPVTSIAALGNGAGMATVDAALAAECGGFLRILSQEPQNGT